MNTYARSAAIGGGLALAGASIVLGLAGPAQADPGYAPAVTAPTTTAPPAPSAAPTALPSAVPTPGPPQGTSIEVPAGNAGSTHTGAGTPIWEVAGLLGAGLTLLGGGVVAAGRR